MEQLNHLIKDAANQFQCHNYNTSLSLYKRCVEKCQYSDHPIYVLNNLKSSVAALETILGNYDPALQILTQVLKNDKQHWLSLMRRSQVYKKKLQFKKAMKDLDVMAMFAPDNLHVAALKLQIKGLMSKKGQYSDESEENQSQNEDINEEELLKFSNLKKIDRTSVSIMLKKKGRQSRVTICGDIAIEYDIDEEMENDDSSYLYNPKIAKSRFIEISKEIEEDQTETSDISPASVIKTKQNGRTKSILRNRDSKIYFAEKKPQNTVADAEKMINKLQDIDGKVIKADSISYQSRPSKEVGFRKSIFASQQKQTLKLEIPTKKKKSTFSTRKSCLKRSSFAIDFEEIKKGPRRSKFELMKRDSVDGKFISASKERIQQDKENRNSEGGNDSQEEEGSQYNIFGNQQVNISKELRQNLGLTSDDDILKSCKEKKKQRGKSILKKNSVFIEKKKASIFCAEVLEAKSSQKEEEKEQDKAQEDCVVEQPYIRGRKAKKSVMFKNY